MFQLIDNIDPINNDNDTMQYSPKLKRFVPIHHNHNYKKLGKIKIIMHGKDVNKLYNKALLRLKKRVKQMNGNTYIHMNYQQQLTNKKKHSYQLIMNAIAIRRDLSKN